ncbi:MAG: acyltransferase [Lachnospiraceae bacterium]|nr:acyltransferase [Lachnospiraceae bacterium]
MNNSFLSYEELENIGFKRLGGVKDRKDMDILISRKASIYSPEKISIGNHVRIDDFCILSGCVDIGSYVHIAAYSALYGGEDGIYISDFANLSSRVTIYSVNDDYSGETLTNPMICDEYKNVHSEAVKIEKHVIIGSTSVILPGVNLAEGSAFGSFSFINHDSEAWSINAGIPFQKISDRKREVLVWERKFVNRNQER